MISTLVQSLNKSEYHGPFVVLAGFICNFIVFGICFSYGVFQEFYSSSSGPLSHSKQATVSMIGTVASATTYTLSIFNNTLVHKFGSPKYVMQLGSVVMSLGLLLGSLCQQEQPYQFILSQGLCFGVGASLVYTPAVTCAPPYFNRHKGVAMGILFSGSGIGALVTAPIIRLLITSLGWRWCLRVMGFITLCITCFASLLVNQHPTYRSNYTPLSKTLNYKVVDLTSLISQLAAGFFQSAGYLIALNYMSTYCQTLGFSAKTGATFIAVNNGINALFKVLIGHTADYTGRLNTLLVCNFLSAVFVLTLWMIQTRGTFVAFVVVYGIVSGAIISLLPTCLSEIFGNKNYQSVSGLMYFFRGLGNLLGSPIAGLLIVKSDVSEGYRNAIVYNGVLLIVSTICIGLLKFRVAKGLVHTANP